jgi:hypothetical protein
VSARLRAARANCPACHRRIALRQDGTMRPHWTEDADTGLRYITDRCPGVGQRPAAPSDVEPRRSSR